MSTRLLGSVGTSARARKSIISVAIASLFYTGSAAGRWSVDFIERDGLDYEYRINVPFSTVTWASAQTMKLTNMAGVFGQSMDSAVGPFSTSADQLFVNAGYTSTTANWDTIPTGAVVNQSHIIDHEIEVFIVSSPIEPGLVWWEENLTTTGAVIPNAGAVIGPSLVDGYLFNDGVGSCTAGGTYPNCSYGATDIAAGSWFSMDTDGDGNVSGFEKTPIEAFHGLTSEMAQTVSGSHVGAINGTESPAIDNPWEFFGDTGMHFNAADGVAFVDDGHTDHQHLDFTGWGIDWGGNEIDLGGDPANFPSDTGLATIVCSSPVCSTLDTYVLDYEAHVPLGDPSNFGGVSYKLHLEGIYVNPSASSTASTVPIPSVVWLFSSGLLGLISVARRKKS